jgi:hypothetical protein
VVVVVVVVDVDVMSWANAAAGRPRVSRRVRPSEGRRDQMDLAWFFILPTEKRGDAMFPSRRSSGESRLY